MRRRMLTFGVALMAAVIFASGIVYGLQHTDSAAATTIRRPPAVKPPKGKPEFSATFSGSHVKTKVWATCYPKSGTGGCTNFGNKEYQWYLPSQVRVSDRILDLSARRVATRGKAKNGKAEEYGCRSGMVTTYPSFHFTYGFVQVVAKVPHKAGLWPALWLAPVNGAYPPEIDMIEVWSGYKNETASFFHPVGAPQDRGYIPVSLTKSWQTYSLSWTKRRLTYYVGKKVVLTVTKRIPHQAMYFLANVAEYMAPKKGDCSGEMQIRSVKVWK